jgi:hypothetical protein
MPRLSTASAFQEISEREMLGSLGDQSSIGASPSLVPTVSAPALDDRSTLGRLRPLANPVWVSAPREPAQADTGSSATGPTQAITEARTILQTWEGVVVSRVGEEFEATLRDLTDRSAPAEAATFPVSEVSPDDRRLIEPGAVFYWFLGQELSSFGQLKRISTIRFRRLPMWTDAQRRRAAEKSQAFAASFGLNP